MNKWICALLCAAALASVITACKKDREVYYITATDNLRIRSEPDRGAENIIAMLAEGDTITLLEKGEMDSVDGIDAPWVKIKTADGTTGWVFSGYLTAAADSETMANKTLGESPETGILESVETEAERVLNDGLEISDSADGWFMEEENVFEKAQNGVEDALNSVQKKIADGLDVSEKELEGNWSSVPSAALGMQFLFSDSGSISAEAMFFAGNRCAIGSIRGVMGMGSSKRWEGTFNINKAGKTLELIDDFGDVTRYRYVLSETEDELVLKLKNADGKITTWYKSKS
ncbi:MAG: hypothetical protein Pg6A_16980 [Termitinemataceae bacterium]|nr:MAG: hypothetical protein Pg6A_16980 [Termitinemataceae bacterium]